MANKTQGSFALLMGVAMLKSKSNLFDPIYSCPIMVGFYFMKFNIFNSDIFGFQSNTGFYVRDATVNEVDFPAILSVGDFKLDVDIFTFIKNEKVSVASAQFYLSTVMARNTGKVDKL